MSAMRPMFTFYGGKWRDAPNYPPPTHAIIVEPFAGAAGFSLRHHARRVVLVDADPVIAATWRYLTSVSANEILSLPDVGFDQTVDDLRISQEARWLIGWWLNKGASRPRKSPSAWMRAGSWPTSFWSPAIRQRIARQLPMVRHWEVIEGSYECAPEVEASWFVDPPYQVAGKHYVYGSSGIDYRRLGEWCRARKGDVTVCENVGATWLPFRPWRDVKASEARHGGKVSREAIWSSPARSEAWQQEALL